MLTPVGVIWSELGGGRVPANVTWKFEPATFPAKSVTRTIIRLTPTLREMLQEKLPPLTVAADPLQVAEETPDSMSEVVPKTVTEAVENPVPSAGDVTARIG